MSDISQQQFRTRETIAILEGRVKEGVRLFDEKGPDDWFDLVDLDDFNMGSLSTCVLGWVHGSFGQGCEALGLDPFKAWEYGFDLGPKDPWSHETLIAAAWRRTIGQRRTPVAAAS